MPNLTACFYTAIFALGLAIGVASTHVYEHREVLKLELAIRNADLQAVEKLQKAKDDVAAADLERINKEKELDKANEQHVQTINYYVDKLAADKLRDPNASNKSCRNTLPTSGSTGNNTENAGNTNDISEELSRLLRDESYRADRCALDKNYLLTWVVKDNCGIKRKQK